MGFSFNFHTGKTLLVSDVKIWSSFELKQLVYFSLEVGPQEEVGSGPTECNGRT